MGQTKLVSLRLAIPIMLVAAVVAAGFTYLVALIAPPSPVEVDHRAPPTASSSSVRDTAVPMRIGRPANDEEKAVAAFQRAADEILKRAANLQASAAATGDLPISGKVPLPKRRPIPRP
jgi:hypothetical protein